MTIVPERFGAVCNGLTLSVHRWRAAPVTPPAGVPSTAVLIHGFLDVGHTWNRMASRLAAAGVEVIAPDLRGFGRSEAVPPGGYYHFPDYVADMRDLVEAHAPGPILLVGHSMGGTVSTYFAGAFPDQVGRLVLIEGIGPMSEPPTLGVDRMRRWLGDLKKVRGAGRLVGSRENALDKLAATHPRVPREILVEHLPHLLADDDPPRWAHDPRHRTTAPTAFSSAVFQSFVRAITCPVLFVGGGPHGFHPPDEDERLGWFARIERLVIDDAGHMLHWTHPDVVVDRILAPAAV